MAKNFTSTLEKMFIMNPSFLFSSAWSLIKNIIHPETAAKINILKKKDFGQLLQYIEIDQIEEKYGGTIPNKTIYWPPENTLKQTKQNNLNPDENMNTNHMQQSSQQSYKTIENDSQVFFEKSNGSPSKNDSDELHEIDGISKPIQNTNSCCKCNIY